MVQIINLTPHPLVVCKDDQGGANTGFVGVGKTTEVRYSVVATIPPSGKIARASQVDAPVGEVEIEGVPVPLITSTFGETTDLPEPQDETLYCVSILTAQSAKAAGRTTSDLLVSSDPVRDADGKIVGVRKFAVL